MEQTVNYTKLLPSSIYQSQVEEQPQPFLFLTERHLQAMWLEQKYFKNLTTDEGKQIQVLSPGIWNAEAGPDFLKAHLIIDGQEFRGDIELHLAEESWYHHGHQFDPRYDSVILHVCFWQPVKMQPILTSKSHSVHKAYIENHLTVPETRLLKLIDLDLYPYQRFVGSGRCASQLFSSLSHKKTAELLRAAASWRLQQKLQLLKEKIGTANNCLAGGIAMALGYKHNAETFLEVYLQLRSINNTDPNSLLAYALGTCGFFDEAFRIKWAESVYYQSLLATYETQFKNRELPRLSLRLDKIRPANHPVRRLAFMAKMVIDNSLDNLQSRMDSEWHALWPRTNKTKWNDLLKIFYNLIPNYPDNYWEYHYTFEKDRKTKATAWVGADLKREILLNMYLPLLYEGVVRNNNPDEMESFQQFYGTLPASHTRKSTYLSHRFFGNTNKTDMLSQADLQQGAYQLHRDFCIHYEASCQGCPFVEKYKAHEILNTSAACTK